MGEALSQFVEEAQHLSSQFDSTTVFSIAGWNVSQYVLYMLVALVLVAALVLIAGRKLTLVPHGKFAHIFEFGYNFISEGVGADVIGEGFKKHVPFLATLFFFILTANIIGLIPGAKAAMGTISITWALAAISFIYFNFWGLKELGFFHYFKSLCPSGVPAPIAPIIGNHHLPADRHLPDGYRCGPACNRMVLLAVLHVCARNPRCFLAGIRIHHSVFFLHRYGNPSSLIRRNSFRLAPLAAQAA